MSFGDSLRKAMDSEIIEPPKNTYKVRLYDASAFTSKAGDEYAKVTLEIIDGDLKGSRFEHFMGFKNEIAKQINGEALATYGVDLTKVNELSDLDDQLDELVKAGVTADVGVSYNDKGFMNVRVAGSRRPDKSDIPANGYVAGMDEAREQQAEFSQAAQRFGDDAPF